MKVKIENLTGVEQMVHDVGVFAPGTHEYNLAEDKLALLKGCATLKVEEMAKESKRVTKRED